jgi:hypothetical protein
VGAGATAAPVFSPPSQPRLERILSDLGGHPVSVVERRPTPYESTFPAEVVTSRDTDGAERRLFCKYGWGEGHPAYGHRADVAYEADVYRHVLAAFPTRTAPFFGSQEGPEGTLLVLEYLPDAVRLSEAISPESMPAAARWLGQFHGAHAPAPPDWLTRYDAQYYRGWLDRTLRFLGDDHDSAWLRRIEQRLHVVNDVLLTAPRTVIHGEYYPRNILIAGEAVYPVDWESAAVAPGEIDLAMLTDGWPSELADSCVRTYLETRWDGGPPPDFARRLDCARAYVVLRWLGDRPEWTSASRYRLDDLRSLSERLGLL